VSPSPPQEPQPPHRLLALDGGGIRGIIPAMVLADLERRSARRTAELFELIAGTSTGGIIALALTTPGPEGRPAWSAEDLVSLYSDEGPRIFDRSRVRALHGIFDERYEAAALEAVLERYLGEARLSQSVSHVLLPTYDTVSRSVFFFDSVRAAREPEHDCLSRFAARATSAAPTYFEPPARPADAPHGEQVFVDGGLFANNPAMCALAEAQRGRFGTDVLLVSVGTGSQTRPLPSEEIRHWGLAQWARPILHVVLDSVSIAIDHQLTALLGTERYWRFQVELTHARDDLDDASPENLERLRGEAQRLIAERAADLDRLAAQLTAARER
jgi:patatin-like phospholipase/acyl hydrolase